MTFSIACHINTISTYSFETNLFINTSEHKGNINIEKYKKKEFSNKSIGIIAPLPHNTHLRYILLGQVQYNSICKSCFSKKYCNENMPNCYL